MNKINRKVEYALMALKLMMEKTPGELTAVKTLCEALGTPFDPTAKVLQALVHAEVLRSVQGPQGGYQIVKDLRKVSFYELNEIVMGPVEVIKCLKTSSPCELVDTCNIQSPLRVLNIRLIEFYKSISLHEILSPNKNSLGQTHRDDLSELAEKWL
ncbi:MAG: Rrf2 family transcriptional regulator [Bdellovibrionales bacterium]